MFYVQSAFMYNPGSTNFSFKKLLEKNKNKQNEDNGVGANEKYISSFCFTFEMNFWLGIIFVAAAAAAAWLISYFGN